MLICRKNYAPWANLLYWDGQYGPIKYIYKLFSDITNHGHRQNFCFRCLGNFTTPEILEHHKLLITRDDFIAMVYVRSRGMGGPGTIGTRELII